MSRLIVFLLFIFTSLGIIAQRPRYEKMSPFVREAMASALATKQFIRSRSDDRLLTAFVRIDGNAAEVLRLYGCKELARVGDISITAIPLSNLGTLSCGRQVKRIETERRYSIQMNTTRLVVNAEKIYTGEGLSQSYTGHGVVVGVQDIGFDLTHPNFYSADMSRYRIKALWDQLSRDTIGSTLYVGHDYVGRDALLRLGHPIDGETQTHGTHTTGIAAGSGTERNGVVSPYRGIACDTDLVLIDNAADNASLIDPEDYYKFAYATGALGFKYVFDYAERMHQPCVINFSEGSSQDFHGYDRLCYKLLAKLIGPGRIIVSSAGNDGARDSYIHENMGKERAGAFIMGNEKRFSCTAESKQTFTFRVSVYDNVASPQIVDISTVNVCNAQDSLLTDSLLIGGKRYIWRVLACPNSYGARETAYDFQIGSPSKLGDSPQVSLRVIGRDADIELYHMSGYMFPHSLDPVLDTGDCRYTIFSPSSSPDVVCVGSTSYRTQFINYLGEKKVYDSGQKGIRSSFSTMGPTLDGRIKPDVMAPGQNVISSYSTFFINNPKNVNASIKSDVRHFEYDGRTYAWDANTGTSMSTPVVTGAIALWLQADPTLTPADCLEIFAKTCSHYGTSLSYPNDLYGYGQIDVATGLREVLRRKALSINTIGQKKISEQYNNRIYLLDGRYVGTSDANLPKGIYIRSGKRFVK